MDVTSTDFTGSDITSTPDRAAPLRDLDIRRALLAVLVDANRPMKIDEIVAGLADDHGIVLEGRQVASAGQRVADMARYQLRRGRVSRAGRGRYLANPDGMSRSMTWRCRNWRLLRDRYFEFSR